MGVAMPEETGLDTAIPAIGWQDTARESPPKIRRQRAQKKKKQPLPAPATPSKKQPDEATGTNIDVIV